MRIRQGQNLLDRRRKRTGARWTALLLFLFIVGFPAVPHLVARRLPLPSGPPADAVLVLTGGENRIALGARAWKEGRGKELYILGAGAKLLPERILADRPKPDDEDIRRLHVEGWSENTMENAFSAKSVVAAKGYTRVILVTSDYHLPRAHLALRTTLPATVSIAVLPVRSDWKWGRTGLRTLRLFFMEGWKYWGYRLFLRFE